MIYTFVNGFPSHVACALSRVKVMAAATEEDVQRSSALNSSDANRVDDMVCREKDTVSR